MWEYCEKSELHPASVGFGMLKGRFVQVVDAALLVGEGSPPVRHSLQFADLFSLVLATSDPRDPLFSKPRTFYRGQKYTRWLHASSRRAGTRALPELYRAAAECNSDLAHYSNTPHGPIRGRGREREQPARRSPNFRPPPAQSRPRKRGTLHKKNAGEVGRTTRPFEPRLRQLEQSAVGSCRSAF